MDWEKGDHHIESVHEASDRRAKTRIDQYYDRRNTLSYDSRL